MEEKASAAYTDAAQNLLGKRVAAFALLAFQDVVQA